MKPFLQYYTEQAAQPQTHAGVTGKTVTITKQADGTQWCTGATISQITPDNAADTFNLTTTDGNSILVKLTPDQTHSITQGQEVTAVHDGFEFFFGGKSTGGAMTEGYEATLKKMGADMAKTLGAKTTRMSGRQEFEYSGIPGIGKLVHIEFGGEDEPYVIVSVGGKETDFSKGKNMAGDIAKFLGVKPV